ncbi:MAG: hypothetical protein VYC39_03605 [Myxococcota bacterium]|nr:hypothetical protein [Myxococcota bacterium]
MKDSWTVDPNKLDLSLFVKKTGQPTHRRLPFSAEDRLEAGEYVYGPKLRSHKDGDTFLALFVDEMNVVEIDRYSVPPYDFQREAELLKNLSMASQVRHRNLPDVLALGIADEFPFVVRPLIVGRDLAYALPKLTAPSRISILFRVFRLIDFLEKQSPFPGAYQFGYFEPCNIHLSFSGRILITGLGSQSLRNHHEKALLADRQALMDLAEILSINLKTHKKRILEPGEDLRACIRHISALNPEWCARTEENLSVFLRAEFLEEIQDDRAFYGLHTLQ